MIFNDPGFEQRIKELMVAYGRAEGQIKSSERMAKRGTCIPAINELRCAGMHILQSLTAQDPGKREKELEEAFRHAQRAGFDASETTVLFLLDEVKGIEDFIGDHFHVLKECTGHDFADLRKHALEAQAFLEETKKEENESREEYCDRCFEFSDALHVYVKAFRMSKDKIASRIRAESKKEFRAAIAWLATVLAVIIGLAGLLVTLLK